MAARLSFPNEVRLACQTELSGSVRLWRLVLDRIDVEMASQLGKGHYRGPVGREVEEAAVMFTDVVGFTTMSESLPAYDVVHILNRFFSRVGAAVESQGGRVDNYMGDGLLAVFGVNNESGTALSPRLYEPASRRWKSLLTWTTMSAESTATRSESGWESAW